MRGSNLVAEAAASLGLVALAVSSEDIRNGLTPVPPCQLRQHLRLECVVAHRRDLRLTEVRPRFPHLVEIYRELEDQTAH